MSTQTTSGPITTWQAVAQVLGLSYDTIWRRRKAKGDTTELPFRNEDEVWKWWRALKPPATPPPAPAPKRRPGAARELDGPLDPRARRRRIRDGT